MNLRTIQRKYSFKFPFKPDPLAAKALRYCKGERLLDVGCGEGADSAFFAQKKRLDVTSFDVNKEYLNRFRAYRRDQKLKNCVIVALIVLFLFTILLSSNLGWLDAPVENPAIREVFPLH